MGPVAQAGAQSHQGLAVQLADAALADAEHDADFTQVEFVLVVQAHDQLFALGQLVDTACQCLFEVVAQQIAFG